MRGDLNQARLPVVSSRSHLRRSRDPRDGAFIKSTCTFWIARQTASKGGIGSPTPNHSQIAEILSMLLPKRCHEEQMASEKSVDLPERTVELGHGDQYLESDLLTLRCLNAQHVNAYLSSGGGPSLCR